jgi:hypothetical protein
MRRTRTFNKITKVSAPKLRQACHPEARALCPAKDLGEPREASRSLRRDERAFGSLPYFVVTSECVIACTDNAIRFCTPTLRISFATCAFTVRSSIPS